MLTSFCVLCRARSDDRGDVPRRKWLLRRAAAREQSFTPLGTAAVCHSRNTLSAIFPPGELEVMQARPGFINGFKTGFGRKQPSTSRTEQKIFFTSPRAWKLPLTHLQQVTNAVLVVI